MTLKRRHLRPIEQRKFYGNKYTAVHKMSDSEQADLLIALLDAGNWHEYWNYRKVIKGAPGAGTATVTG